MRHLKRGKKFGRTRNQRRALLRNLLFQLVMQERLVTTEAKARELQRAAEKIVAMAKQETLAARRSLSSRLPDAAATKLYKTIAPRLAERRSGYTRLVKIGPRRSDASRMAIIEFVESKK